MKLGELLHHRQDLRNIVGGGGADGHRNESISPAATRVLRWRDMIRYMSANPTSVVPALAGNVIGAPNGAFVIAEWSDPGAVIDPATGAPRRIAPLHVHHRDDEAWYVLEGALRIRVGDKEVETRAGSAVFVPRGTPHTYWNAEPAPARHLLIMTANIHRLIQAIHGMKDR